MDEKIEKAMERLALFNRKKWEKKKACIAAGLGVGLLAIVYFCGVWYYSGRFFEGTRIGSVLCENMTADEAEQAIYISIGKCGSGSFGGAECFSLAKRFV